MSTGEGKPSEKDENKTTIYKHQVDQTYNLKMKASREVFSQVTGDHPTLPFTLRQYEGSRTRLGMKECINHDLFTTYPVLEEKEGNASLEVSSPTASLRLLAKTKSSQQSTKQQSTRPLRRQPRRRRSKLYHVLSTMEL